MNDFFSWNRITQNFPLIIEKLPITIEIVTISFLIGMVLAFSIAAVNIRKIPVLTQILRVFISFERGTPLLVQMLVVYYLLPLLLESWFKLDTRGWGKIIFVDIALTLNQGAFLSETFRAAILAIPNGQREASLSCGLTEFQAFRRIILPQVIRICIPPLGTNLIGLFQSTSLVFMIGVIDMVGLAKAIGGSSGHATESYVIVGIIFAVISILIQLSFRKLDKKRW